MSNQRNKRPHRNILWGLENNPTQGTDILRVLVVGGLGFLLIVAFPPLAILLVIALFILAIYQGIQNNS
jgi:hypothetical protein